jgi:hypothetical protein
MVDGIPWFHDQRRRWLFDRMEATERALHSEAALPVVMAEMRAVDAWLLAPAYATLARAAASRVPEHPAVQATALTDSRLAIIGSLIDLIEPGRVPAVAAQPALAHARATFGVAADLVEGLTGLAEQGVIALAQDGRAAAVAPTWKSEFAIAAAGECQLRFGRLPAPGLATTAWSVAFLRQARSFARAIYGVGSPSPGTLLQNMRQAQPFEERIRPITGVIAYATYREADLYVVATMDEGVRDELVESMDGFEATIDGSRLAVNAVLRQPAVALPARRWTAAVEDLLGKSLTSTFAPAVADMTVDEVVTALAAIRQEMWARLTPKERVVSDWRLPTRYVYEVHERGYTVFTVEGSDVEPGAERVEAGKAHRRSDAFEFFEYARSLNLPFGAHLGHIRWSSSEPRHPAAELAIDFEKEVATFNSQQRSLEIDLHPEVLEETVHSAISSRREDVIAISKHLPGSTDHIGPKQVFMLITKPSREALIDSPGAVVARMKSNSRDEAHVAIRHNEVTGWGAEELARQFGLPLDERGLIAGATLTSYALASHAVAELLGYRDQDVSVRRSATALGLTRGQ